MPAEMVARPARMKSTWPNSSAKATCPKTRWVLYMRSRPPNIASTSRRRSPSNRLSGAHPQEERRRAQHGEPRREASFASLLVVRAAGNFPFFLDDTSRAV